MKSKTSSKFNLRNYLIASITLHLLLLLGTNIAALIEQRNAEKKIEVVLLSEEDLKALRDEKNPNQIVETDSRFANNQLNENAKYHSEKSNTVEKETRAKTGQEFKNSLRQGAKTVQTHKESQKQQKAADLLNPSFDPYAALMKKNQAQEEKQAQLGQTGVQAGDTSTTNDNLNVQEDLITKLNTKEYKY